MNILYNKDDMEKLHFFFKSHLSYLYSALGKKDLPNHLVHNKTFQNQILKKETISRLLRMVNTKTKYRYRQKLQLNTIAQLKNIFESN